MSRVKLTTFGDVDLPEYNPRLGGGSAPTREATITLADGTIYDGIGASQAEAVLPYSLTYDCVAMEDDDATLQTTLAALFALRGQRLKLYRRLLSDEDVITWAWARLMRLSMPSGPIGQTTHIPLSFQFEILSAWHGHYHTTWFFDDGYYFDDGLYFDDGEFVETMASSPHVITVTNGGNATCRDGVISITAGTANISSLTIASGGTDIDWTGTITAGNTLVIDCGAKSVKNNGVNAYSGFAYGGSHTLNGWLELPAGDTNITITFAGGSTDSTVSVEFYDTWE